MTNFHTRRGVGLFSGASSFSFALAGGPRPEAGRWRPTLRVGGLEFRARRAPGVALRRPRAWECAGRAFFPSPKRSVTRPHGLGRVRNGKWGFRSGDARGRVSLGARLRESRIGAAAQTYAGAVEKRVIREVRCASYGYTRATAGAALGP